MPKNKETMSHAAEAYTSMDHEPRYVGSGSDGVMKPTDSAGVGSGLSHQADCHVKDDETVTENARPEGNVESIDGFKCGVF